jgi:thioredoxin-like negative regulator of GroEL
VAESAVHSTTSKVKEGMMAGLSMVLFRDGDGDDSHALTTILGDIVRSRADGYSVTEVDVHDQPGLAARYNVRITPTILLMQHGDVVDRVVGTPTTILLHSLLDTRSTGAALPFRTERRRFGSKRPRRAVSRN